MAFLGPDLITTISSGNSSKAMRAGFPFVGFISAAAFFSLVFCCFTLPPSQIEL